jgi:hypothetical protein
MATQTEWEYELAHGRNAEELANLLKKVGAAGWELASAAQDQSGAWVGFLKRPKEKKKPAKVGRAF